MALNELKDPLPEMSVFGTKQTFQHVWIYVRYWGSTMFPIADDPIPVLNRWMRGARPCMVSKDISDIQS